MLILCILHLSIVNYKTIEIKQKIKSKWYDYFEMMLATFSSYPLKIDKEPVT